VGMDEIIVVGAGLAGVEAANAITRLGIKVKLFEMKPKKFSPAHKLDRFAELVCSNSLKSEAITNASGLLKKEMMIFGSLVIEAAYKTRVEAGQALAVDRNLFSEYITKKIKENPLIEVIHEEVKEVANDRVIVFATGPLTSEDLLVFMAKMLKSDNLYFFDAAAPIIFKDSIDFSKAFFASRYNKGNSDYINCPMDNDEYERFYYELTKAQVREVKDFEKNLLFEGGRLIEEMAKRGFDTMRFGPLKPVGIIDPKTGKNPYAVVQLRKDTQDGTLYNMVGFQTRLKWSEQKRVFRLLPALQNAEFARYGVMHKNSYINSPKLLSPFLSLREYPNIFFAGQITGVEGYLESASTGILAGINAAMYLLGKDQLVLPNTTCMGALIDYITHEKKDFQPINANYGIISIDNELSKIKDKDRRRLLIAERSLNICRDVAKNIFQK